MTEEERIRHLAKHRMPSAFSWWLRDANGIELCRVCDECEATARARYDPAIFNAMTYDSVVEEQIEPD